MFRYAGVAEWQTHLTQNQAGNTVWVQVPPPAPTLGGKTFVLPPIFIIVFRLVRDVVANHKTTRYAGAATKVIQKNHLA